MSTLPMLAAVDPSWLLLAGVALITWVLVRMTLRRLSRGGRPQVGPAPPSMPSPLPHSYHDLIRRMEAREVEFNDLSRDALARLDNKIAILQRLLDESEATIARLERAAERSREAGANGSVPPHLGHLG